MQIDMRGEAADEREETRAKLNLAETQRVARSQSARVQAPFPRESWSWQRRGQSRAANQRACLAMR